VTEDDLPVRKPVGGQAAQPPVVPAQLMRIYRVIWLAVLVVGLGSGFAAAKVMQHRDDAAQQKAEPGRLRPADPAISALPPDPFASPLPRYRPQLVDRTPVRVTGAVYGPGERTETRDDLGLPFAFRLPVDWPCVLGTVRPAEILRHCFVDAGSGDAGQANRLRVRMILRPCPGACAAATRRELDRDWLSEWRDQTGPWKQLPPPTRVVDAATRWTEQRDGTGYVLVMSHVFTAPGGARYHVGAAADGPAAKAAALQKIINDIRTQTP
jgi:hypothetical protein